MYSLVGMGLEGSARTPADNASQLLCAIDSACWALDRTSRPPRPVRYELLPGGEAPAGLAQRLLGPGGSGGGGSWVLDGAAFVSVAEQLPASQLRASLENCLLECTSTRLAQLAEQPSLSATKVNTGAAALVQLLVGAGRDGGQPLELFPPSAGLPSLGELLTVAVLPPSATSRLLPQPVLQLFAAHCSAGAGRRSAAEHYDMGSLPSLYDRARSHTRAAACRGGTFYTLLSGPPLWQRFHMHPASSGSDAAHAAAGAASSKAAGKAAAGKQPRQKRKQEAPAAATAAAAAAAGGPQRQPPASTRPPQEPRTLVQSACSCCQPDLGVLWCSHRCDAAHGLLCDPALHVLDCDAMEALLAPLSQRQLAQLLLTVAFACGTLPDVLLSLQLSPARQAALFLPRLGSLSLAVPATSELRMCCHTPADATQAAYYGPGEPYLSTQREAATTCSNPLAPAHTASRLSVLSGAGGSAVQAVEKRVLALTPELCWHLKGMGVDALDGYPESLSTPSPAGIWPADVRAGATLGFEDALGLTRSLSLLGGDYLPVARQLLKDLTVTVSHPHYCAAVLSPASQPAFVRRLVALWTQLTTAEERWALFMERGMRLPSIWSNVVREVAWEGVGQFATMWAVFRHAKAMGRSTSRSAAMALVTRSTLLPRGGAAAGASAMTDLLLFERSMRRGFVEHLQGLMAFLKPRLASLRPPREGSLLQLAARSYGKQLTQGKTPLAQSYAAFNELILDLQEAVLAESARLLVNVCEREIAVPQALPGTPEAAQPSDLRAAGPALKAHTVGLLNTGLPFNANGLQRHALPAHLPPALTSSPFSWVTLDVGAMLTTSVDGSEAPAWACAYLTLAPKYSPAGAVPLWAWLRAGGMLGRLLNAACSAVARRDWHTAAMLGDAACKYLASSSSLAAAGVASEQLQLQQLRPTLRSLALAAAAQLQECLTMHRAGVQLTHTSSLRACCLLLRSVLSLSAEQLDPVLLQGPAAAANDAMDAIAAGIQGLEAMVAPGEPLALLPPGLAPAPGLVQALNAPVQAMHQQLQAMHQQLGVMQQQAAQAAQEVAQMQQQVAAIEEQQAQQGAQQGVPEQAQGAQQPAQQPAQGIMPQAAQPGPSPVAAATAAVAGGSATAIQLSLPAAEALARDAIVLLTVSKVLMQLASATIDAPPLLPLASGSATAATSSVARRAMHDTALWRAAEVSSETGQYPYSHDLVQDETHPRTFVLNDLALLLAQQLPVAVLPLQQAAPRTAPAAAGAVEPSGSRQPQQQPAGRQQAARPSSGGGPQTRRRAQQDAGVRAAASPAAVPAVAQASRQSLAGMQESTLLALLPELDQLMGQLLDNFDTSSKSRADSAVASIRHRFKSGPMLSLAVTLLRLAASSGTVAPQQLAATPNTWKLLCSYMLEAAASSPTSNFNLRLFALAPPTLLAMLQACTVAGGEGDVGTAAGAAAGVASAAAAAADGGEEQDEEAEPPSKRRRRSSRPRGHDPAPSGRRSSAGGRMPQPGEGPSTGSNEAATGSSTAAAADTSAAVGKPGAGRITVGGTALEGATVQRAVQRVLMWLSNGVQEHWRGSSYTQWRPRVPAPLPPLQQQQQQQQQGQQQQQQQQEAGAPGAAAAAAPVAGAAAAAAGQAGAAGGPQPAGQQQVGQPPPGAAMPNAAQAFAAMNGVGPFEMLAAANLEEQLLAAEAEAAEFGLPAHMMGMAAAAMAAVAGMAGALGAAGAEPPRPRRAFQPRNRTGAMASALVSGWPVSAVGVVHWWLRHRAQLQCPEFVTGPAAGRAAAAAADEAGAADAAGIASGGGQQDPRSSSFLTLDGLVSRPADLGEPQPKLSLLCGTLLALLCMECAPEVHAAVTAALQGAAEQPATAQVLVDCGSFWTLNRLLLREDLPADLKAQGSQVVAGVKQTLLAQSGDWAAVFDTQQAAATDAETLAAERRALAVQAMAARAAEGPGGGAAPPQPPHWFMGQLGLFPGQMPPPGMVMGDEFDDEFEGASDEEEDDMSEEEDEDEFMHDEMMAHAMAMGAPPGGFFF